MQGSGRGCHPAPPDGYHSEKAKKYRDGTLPIIYGTDGSLHPSPRGTSRSSTWTSVRAAFAIAYMAAEANEDLTGLIRRAGPKAWSPRLLSSYF